MSMEMVFAVKGLEPQLVDAAQDELESKGYECYFRDEWNRENENDLYTISRSHPVFNLVDELFPGLINKSLYTGWITLSLAEWKELLDVLTQTVSWASSLEAYPSGWRAEDVDLTRRLGGLMPVMESYPEGYGGIRFSPYEDDAYTFESILCAKCALDIIDKYVDEEHPAKIVVG